MKKVYFLLLALPLSFNTLQADLAHYFKKIDATSKKGFQRNEVKNIDFIYVINLDKQPEKFEGCVKQLNLYGIHPFRFSAVNGWELSINDLNQLGVTNESALQMGEKGLGIST